ncbi:MAG: PAS domain S-box protein, partial [Gallionella sp.]|nr:PAS domain S-box protein [Gallionella sp.]
MLSPDRKEPEASSGKTKSIYRELTMALVVLVSLVSIAATLLNYIHASREAEANYESKSSEYAVYLHEALEWPLWNIDDELIGKIGSAFVSNAEIVTLIIRDDQQRIIFRQEKSSGHQLKHSTSIEHNGNTIGSVEIGLDLRAYEEREQQLLLYSLATMSLLIVVLLGATRWILSRLLRKPVNAFVGVIDGMVEGKYRQIELPKSYVEFTPILSRFKTMSDAVASREASLHASEQKLLNILESVDACIYLKDTQGRYLFANRPVRDLWHAEMEDIVGFGDEKFFDAATVANIRRNDRRVLEDGETIREEEVNTVPITGKKVTYQSTKLPLRNEDGSIYALCGISVDVTERKQAEVASKVASQYARSLIEASLDPLVTINAVGKITDVNHATEKVTGRTRLELIGTDFSDYFTEPDKARAGYRQVFAQSFVTDYPLVLRHRDGHLIDVLYNASVYRDDEGKVLGVFAAARDITERMKVEFVLRQSEEALKEAQRIAHLGSWHLDLATNQVVWSEELYKLYGFDPALPPPLYTESMKLFTPESWERLSTAITNTTETGIPYELELETVQKDGARGWMLARGEQVRDARGATVRVRGVAMDITERKRAEIELRRYKDHLEEEVQLRTADLLLARDAAEAANRAKSVFLSSMSHELRTPLNAILGFSNILRQDTQLRQGQRENLDIINRSGEHLLTLINDVLEMAKIESGRVEVESVPFDLGGMVRDVIDMMHMRAQEKGLQLLVDQSSEFPRYIKGDEARLRQVLINLVGNAVKFTQQGGVTVRFGMKPHVTQKRLLIEVEDSGLGIRPEDQQRIFEPFVQLSESAMQKGTGLGLTITRQYVKLMGGTIGVESTPGTGSIFRVELPADMVAASEVVKVESVIKGEVVSLAPGQPEYRILIVEDQLENQLLLTQLMKSIGLPVKVAENGAQAVDIFQSWSPHLIWMDRR